MTVLCFYQTDDAGEATGDTVRFCSEPCRDNWYLRVRDPQSLRFNEVRALKTWEPGDEPESEVPAGWWCDNDCGRRVTDG